MESKSINYDGCIQENLMNDISIIVPLYKGNKYISKIVKMIKRNISLLPLNVEIELIFINDYPDKKVEFQEEYLPENLKMHVYENQVNMGIHAARVSGIQKACGKYILLLDQDDVIMDDYLISQWKAIGNADAVVCNGINDYQLLYWSEEQQKKVVEVNEWLQGRNFITTTGQVLIKREAIPDIWLERIMSVNGADDLLLWICMLGKGRRFAINDEVIYERKIHGSNTSLNQEVMNRSLMELCQIVQSSDCLSESYRKIFCSNVMAIIKQPMMNSQQEDMLIISNWLRCYEEGMNMEKLLMNRNYRRIAIYGLGILGKHLYLALRNSKLGIVFGIDRKADIFRYEFPVLKPEDDFPEADVIIVAVSTKFEEISQYLNQKVSCPVISLQEIFTYK